MPLTLGADELGQVRFCDPHGLPLPSAVKLPLAGWWRVKDLYKISLISNYTGIWKLFYWHTSARWILRHLSQGRILLECSAPCVYAQNRSTVGYMQYCF